MSLKSPVEAVIWIGVRAEARGDGFGVRGRRRVQRLRSFMAGGPTPGDIQLI